MYEQLALNWSGICHACKFLYLNDKICPFRHTISCSRNMAEQLHSTSEAGIFFEYRGKEAYAKEVLFGKRESSLRADGL